MIQENIFLRLVKGSCDAASFVFEIAFGVGVVHVVAVAVEQINHRHEGNRFALPLDVDQIIKRHELDELKEFLLQVKISFQLSGVGSLLLERLVAVNPRVEILNG